MDLLLIGLKDINSKLGLFTLFVHLWFTHFFSHVLVIITEGNDDDFLNKEGTVRDRKLQ